MSSDHYLNVKKRIKELFEEYDPNTTSIEYLGSKFEDVDLNTIVQVFFELQEEGMIEECEVES